MATAMVLKQFSGTGSSTIHLGPVPGGYKQLGTTVICTGSGDWETIFVQDGSGWGKGGCTLEGGTSVSYPVDEPAKDQAVEIKVDAGTRVWVTVFATD